MALQANSSIRALLIDISGTLLIGSSPTPGAAQALARLRAAHIPFRLCSNTSKESTDAVHKRMRAAGLDVHRAELWTSIGALRAVLNDLGVKKPYMLLSQSAVEECIGGSETKADADASPVGDPSSSHDAVIVGLTPTLLDYAHLNTAFRILIGENRPQGILPPQGPPNPEFSADITGSRHRPPLIALHKACYFEASDHALSLGPGPFVHALEDAARASAIVVGKPTRAFFETVLRDLERDLHGSAQRVVENMSPHPPDQHRWEGFAVIGDDVHADLGEGAVELGLWRVLVQTGKYRPGDERRTDTLPPNQVCASFAVFVERLIERWGVSS